MHRRSFLQFLGLGMAAATLTPGQLIAAVSRPVQIAVSPAAPVGVYTATDLAAELAAITRRAWLPLMVRDIYRPSVVFESLRARDRSIVLA